MAVSLLALAVTFFAGAAAAETRPLQPASRTPFETDCGCGLGRPASVFEPSGLVWDGHETLYAVSDSGQIVSRGIGPNGLEGPGWSCLYVWCGEAKENPRAKAEHDFESLAFAPGPFSRYLWVGVEGGEYSVKDKAERGAKEKRRLLPQIRKFDLIEKRFVDAYWNLGGVPVGKGSGVESMTFVPGPPGAAPGRLVPNGRFLVSSQHSGEPGKVYSFDLGAPSSKDPETGESYILPVGEPFFLPAAGGGERRETSSDFYYAADSCVLYVSYDDESDAVALDKDGKARIVQGSQAVAVYALRGGGFELAASHPLPAGRGLEAVTAVTRSDERVELYAAVDMSGGQNPGELAATPPDPAQVFAKKKDLKQAKGKLQPNTADRYVPVSRLMACSPRG